MLGASRKGDASKVLLTVALVIVSLAVVTIGLDTTLGLGIGKWLLSLLSGRVRTGSPWRDLPVEFGPWQTVWERHFRWSQDGTYQRIFDGVHLAGLLRRSLDPELERFAIGGLDRSSS